MLNLSDFTLSSALTALERREVSARDLAEASLAAFEAHAGLNAAVRLTPEQARAQAEASDARRARGEARALDGIPIGIKDLFCTEGVASTACSRILSGFTPPYEATVTRQLFAAGAVMTAKLNMDEFAMGSSNETSCCGPVISPWTPPGQDSAPLVPGGSSGGSAAAVAARLVLGATGTDTGGSIRQPAAFTGIVGLKPSYGRCSRLGIIAFASSLDQAGPMALSVEDATRMLMAMAGPDPLDATSTPEAFPDLLPALGQGVRGLRIGIPAEYRPEGLDPEIAALWDRGAALLAAEGAEIVPVSLPHTRLALPCYYIVAPAEASSNLARYDGVRYGQRIQGRDLTEMYERSRAEGFGAEVRRRILIGTYVLSSGYYDAYFLKAQQVRRLIAEDFDQAFASVDAILTPTAPSAAFVRGQGEADPVTMYLNDVFTVPASLAGLPGISIPAGLNASGLPLGLQILTRFNDEPGLVRVAAALERALGFSALPPRHAGTQS